MSNHSAASPEMEKYFAKLEEEVENAFSIATKAREKGFDPKQKVEIFLAENMAERVEGLLSIIYPQIKGSGISPRIQTLEEKYGALAWEVALVIAKEVAEEKFCTFKDKKEAMEAGIRAGFAYHTVGIVSAPLEGFIELKIKKTKDGKEYLALSFAGPIRGAGGTAASVCVVIGDYIRNVMGYAPYDPSEEEVQRFITELTDYHERVTNLQYNPSPEELKFLITHLSVEVDGEASEKMDVSNYKDLPRVESNKIRSGVCLVVSMIALKAPKLWKRLQKWGADFDLDWGFLKEFLILQKKMKARIKGTKKGEKESKISPNFTYIADLVAGRPVLSNPMAPGGFRLRYGRTRLSGFSAAALHPATARLLFDYIATGTQLKVERPGKAAAITFCDTIAGPTVKLGDGSVHQLQNEDEAKKISPLVKEILFLGDILFSYGDFSENGHVLVPVGYVPEWFVQEFEKGVVDKFGSLDLEKTANLVNIPFEHLLKLQQEPLTTKISFLAALSLAKHLNIPLAPTYQFPWKSIDAQNALALIRSLSEVTTKNARITFRNYSGLRQCMVQFSLTKKDKRTLELLNVVHDVLDSPKENTQNAKVKISLKADLFKAILLTSGIISVQLAEEKPENLLIRINNPHTKERVEKLTKLLTEETQSILSSLQQLSDVLVRDTGGTYIGARMGRPEKAKQRKMTGSPHGLFPVGEEGGRLRSFQAAILAGKITTDFPNFTCSSCGEKGVLHTCMSCGKKATLKYYCATCDKLSDEPCSRHQGNTAFNRRSLDISEYYAKTLSSLKLSLSPDLVKGVRGTSNKHHFVEHLGKAILRAKHGVFVNKDGTTRYDMSEVPITHFTPIEVGASVEKLRALGYETDFKGSRLISSDQLLELKPQDVILPEGKSADQTAKDVLFSVAKYIDDLLVRLYGLKPYYNFTSKEELIGCLVIGLAPHISAGLIGRIVGFSKTQGCFAHPLWHAGLRRDCDGDEACVTLLLDGFLNFSSQYLPDTRGAKTMDAPLVLTKRLIPAEVDDMVHGMDVVQTYPANLYAAGEAFKYPWDVDIEQLGSRLSTEKQYQGIGFTHPVSSMNLGVTCSAYKTLPSMEEKLKGQMGLATRIRAVDATTVATLVIEKHFLKDTKGNLRKFSQQQFRCVSCNEKFRRPPLAGACTTCRGRVIFTVSEGSVVKYLQPSISLAEKYGSSEYLKQTLELTKRKIEDTFGREKERQEGLGKWFG